MNAGCGFIATSPENRTPSTNTVSPCVWFVPMARIFCLEATEVECVFVVEHDVGVAMLGVLEQFLVELGARREQRHQVHARACGDVFDLGFRADQLRESFGNACAPMSCSGCT